MRLRLQINHENINTVLAALALLLAVPAAWNQFRPPRDRIDLLSAERVDLGEPINVTASLPLLGPTPGPLVGPVYWKVVLYNPLDRAVTVASIDAFFLAPFSKGLAQYSGMVDSLRSGSTPSESVSAPISIEAHEATSVLIGLDIPTAADSPQSPPHSCLTEGSTLQRAERCRFEEGSDLFGNPVKSQNPAGSALAVTWTGSMLEPRYIVKVKTADGSQFTTVLNYYPLAP